MPITDHSPLGANWESVDKDTGEPIKLTLKPDHLLVMIAQGFTPEEMSVELGMSLEPIEHCIAEIPRMMLWRRQEAARLNHTEEVIGADGARKLPTKL